MRLVLAIALASCQTKPGAKPALVPASAVSAQLVLNPFDFDEPFGELSLAPAFVRAKHVVRVRVHELDPSRPGMSRQTILTSFDDQGDPLAVQSLSSGHDYEWNLDARTTSQRDANGRVIETRTELGEVTRTQTITYDRDNRIIERQQAVADQRGVEKRTYDAAGHLATITRGEPNKPVFATLSVTWDANRMVGWAGSKPGYPDDRYTFTYDKHGQLAQLAFVESGTPIYERAYTYDDAGFLVRVELHSHVSAMGAGNTYLYEYDLADGTSHESQTIELPKPKPRASDDAIAAKVRELLPDAAGLVITWEGTEARPYLDTITFTAKTDRAKRALAKTACALSTRLGPVLGLEESPCSCEYLEPKGNQLVFHMMMGC